MTERWKVRCAIYTRKSSEEGLEQAFNSLDAQHEACAAYVASQKHEGWVLLKDRYDDGGISGGTLERPALQRLLGEIEAGRVDRVVVYKVDRLTRSLADFAKLVERFDKVGASFVSVTQSFNTATSMGRLTLNVLLSFAQFEREVAAERIRDKIAASKRKGMWMGGNVPLGYEAKYRTLVVNEVEAETVRTIFNLYLELGSLRAVVAEAARRGLRTKATIGSDGASRGGVPMSRGQIHYMLANPVYIGRIRHGEKTFDGTHGPIIGDAVWNAVQVSLADGVGRARGPRAASEPAPLLGKFVDETGDRLTPSHANKKGRRYRYYVSNRLIAKSGEAADRSGWCIPAPALERAAAEAIASKLREPDFALRLVDSPSVAEIDAIGRAAHQLAEELLEGDAGSALAAIVASGRIAPEQLRVDLDAAAMATRLDTLADRIAPSGLAIEAPITMRRRGAEARLVIGDAAPPEIDDALLRAVARGLAWLDVIKAGGSIERLAAAKGLSRSRILQIVDIAFLSPALVKAAAAGRAPDGLGLAKLARTGVAAEWRAQAEAAGA